ncbi:MAG: acyltransferase [Desulfobulbaceae bacterium]|nr:acyltransferase [Desulfobulbaceae bacterium]
MQYFNGIQVARGIAALSVVFYHASVWSGEYYGEVYNGFFNFGYIGVDFFFVLSGFLIFYLHRGDDRGRAAWKKYCMKRLIRIYPPFLPLSILLLLVYLNYPDLPNGGETIGIVSSLFLIPSGGAPALVTSWTLMHEILFYAFFSLYFFCRRCFFVFTAIWIVLICARINTVENSYLLSFLLSVHNLEFFFGVAVALAADAYNKSYKKFFTAGILFIVLFVMGSYLNIQYPPVLQGDFIFIYLGIAFSFIVYGLYGLDTNVTVCYPSFLLFLGAASYSIYLVHFPLLSVLNRGAALLYPRIIPYQHLLFWGIVALCTAAGLLYHLLWEKRVTGYLKHRLIMSS